MDKKYTNRSVDNLELKKSKEYLWKYISKKVDMKKKHHTAEIAEDVTDRRATFVDFFKSLFRMPERLVSITVISGLLIVALVFSSTLRGWFGTKIEVVHANFEMVATTEDASGVSSSSGFTLTSTEDLSVDVVKANLKVQPDVQLNVSKIEKDKYAVKPVKGLEGNTIYNFSIQTDHGDLSWAYQIQDTFKVDGSLPANQSTNAPANTGVEINFSHENYDFDHIKDYFEITPTTFGKFEKHGRTVAFVPSHELNAGAIYTVKIKKGFGIAGTDKKLDKDFVFQFETVEAADYSHNLSFSKPYYEIATSSSIAMDVYSYNNENKKDIPVEIYQYSSLDKYLNEVTNSLNVPEWSYYSRAKYSHPTDGLQDLGSFPAVIEKPNYNSYLYIPEKTLNKGYYLFQIDDNGKKSQTLVQITDLSAYINTSLTDSVIWVNDLQTGKPVEGATVQVKDVDATTKTGSDGVAKFETPDAWKNSKYISEYNSSDYISTFIKVTAPDGKTVVTPLDSYVYNPDNKGQNYWQTMITDRPRYKPTDNIHFWGFLKPKSGVAKLDGLKMELMYNGDTFVEDVPMTVKDDGTIEGNFNIKSYTPGYYYLNILQGEDKISSTGFEIEDYIKPAYNLTMESDKQAVFAGEKVNFNIKSEFFDGTPVSNLAITDNGQLDPGHQVKTFTTDSKGGVQASMIARKDDCEGDCSDSTYFYYNVQSKFSEESSIQASSQVQIFDSHLNLSSKGSASKTEEGTTIANIALKSNWIDLTKLNNGTSKQYNDYIADVAKNRKFTGTVTQVSWIKKETGQYYDFINKVTAKTYDYERKEDIIAKINGETNGSGEASYQFPMDADKYYIVNLKADDDQSNTAHSTAYVYGDMSEGNDYDNYLNVRVLSDNLAQDLNDYFANLSEFDIGDTVNTVISKGSNVNLPKDTKGSFLFMQESNGIQKYDIENSPYYSFKFAKENVPNVYVEGVWFDGKSYKTAFSTSVQYKKKLKALTLKVDSDKQEYKPGDEVNLSVFVKNKDGSPTPAKVNFNIVDEAYYKAVYSGMTDPLDQIYSNNSAGTLLSYFTHNNPLNARNEAGGKGGCFTGETQISMADGTTKAIKDIQKGDKILTKESEFSSRLIPAEVVGKVVKHVSEYLVINDKLEVTAEHVVFSNGEWKKVGNLRLGDTMVDKDGNVIKIASMRHVVKPVDVYNIEIKDYHTYFANGFFVHNDKGDDGYYVRQQFKDTALFYSVDVGPDGHGSVKFKVPDNITSWRIVATAINVDDLTAGTQTENIKVTLPFFVDMVVNREYSEKDKPMIKFRAYGKDLKDGDAVSFKPDVDGLVGDILSGKAFVGSYFNLPVLPIGSHDVTVKADAGSMKDALKKTIEIKGSRLTQDVVKTIRNIDDKTVFNIGKQGQTEIEFLDSGVAYYYYNLLSLYYDDGKRLDQIVAGKAAADLLKTYFGKELPKHDEDDGNYILESYQRQGGLALLPYADKDLKLSALVVAFDVNLDRYSKHALRDYFYGVFKNSKSNLDDIVLSLLGLASMKEPVLLDLREVAKSPDLSTQQKLYLGLAYAKIGSYPDARKVLQEVGNKLTGDTSNIGVHNLALGADLASAVNDVQTAETLWKDVKLDSFGNEDLTNLYELGYVTGALKNAKTQPVSFKYKVNNHEENVSIKTGESKSIMASPGDVVAVSVNDGALAAVLNYKDSVEPAQFKKDSRLSITRKYFVNGKETTEFNEGDMVKVVMTLNNPGKIDYPFYRITDILPSGLTPATGYMGGSFDRNLSYPFMINGQEISFCWFPYFQEIVDGTSKSTLNYYAKVVNPGEFYADPAKITSFYDHNVANISDSAMIKINPSK